MAQPHAASAQIVDIRNATDFVPLTEQIRTGLNVPAGHEKRLPTLLLYDKKGLQLFEKITYLDEYYLTNQEIGILEQYADRIAERVALQPDSIVLELGSGNLRKVRLLLDALDKKGHSVTYYALDLSREELERTLAEIPPGSFKHVKCFGLWGTYDDGLAWLKQPKNLQRPKTILSLGSSIGNFDRKEAAEFLKQFSDVLGDHDSFLLAADACTSSDKVYHAYNDKEGLTHEFVLNGLRQANELLGYEAFNLSEWKVIGEYDTAAGRHHAFVSPTKDVEVEGAKIKAGERVRIEESYKYDATQSQQLFVDAGLIAGASWPNPERDYALHLLTRPKVAYAGRPEEYASSPVPTPEDWTALWSAWDVVSQDMIPDEELLEKPIKLRNACIFYLGHIPTFLDIHLTRATGGKPTEPAHYTQIFERGIDPDVDDPEKCHAHSEIPDSWPLIKEVLKFQDDVRKRVRDLYASGSANTDKSVKRALWLAFEHEIMHLETLLYMLVQSEKTVAPPGTVKPDFEVLALQNEKEAVPNLWFDIPEQEFSIGINDPDDESGLPHYFGWDNEKPVRQAKVKAFSIQARPITNGEYAHYLEQMKLEHTPSSWKVDVQSSHGANGHANGHTNRSNGHTNGVNGHANGHANAHTSGANGHVDVHVKPSKHFLHGKAVRTVHGPVSLAHALHWPVAASYDELAGCAAYMGGRIPTMEESRSVYNYAESMGVRESEQSRSHNIPAVNGHLINDGVAETPPANRAIDGPAGPNPRDLFIDLGHTNTGFKHWHPMAVTSKGGKLAGQSDMGGLWEWTSTALASYEGFKAMELYPGYTEDFFDGKHNIVLGGSWATCPRIAGRKSFVNWYQRNYPYVWAGARVVRDIK